MTAPPHDAEKLAGAPPDARVGSILAERYRINELLGEGGMGKVYAAEHMLMRKRLAVKVLHRELTTVPEVVKRFEREAMAAANIEHPNVAAATDFGKLPDGAVFLVLEYVQGKNLRDVIAEGPLPVNRVLHIGRQIASALASAHALKIVHRDLKPENVMLVDKGGDPDFVKVLDFGIAKVPIGEVSESGRPPGGVITKAGMVFGTPEYMAPEQALGQTVDGRADLYALGVILFEMISGVRPFSSKTSVGILGQQLSKPVPRFAERSPGIPVPDNVEALVLRLLERESGERFASADRVVEAMDAITGVPSRGGRRLLRSEASLSELRLTRQQAAEREELPSIPELDSGLLMTALPSALHLPQVPPAAPSAPGPAWDAAKDPPLGVFGDAPDAGAGAEAPASPRPLERAAAPAKLGTLRERGSRLVASLRASTQRARTTLVSASASSIAEATRWIEQRRQTWPERVRRPLEKLSSQALLGVACGAVFAVVLIAVLVVGVSVSKDGSPDTAGAGDTTAKSDIDRARTDGVGALEKLSEDNPKDSAVLLTLAEERMKQGQLPAALQSLTQAITVNPKLADDPRASSVLRKTATVDATADKSFELLEGAMGTKGADVIYELATAEGVDPKSQKRAQEWLTTPIFQRNSSPALNVAVALRHAKTCNQRYGLLLRAKNVGDQRSLAYLKKWQSRSGCGSRGRKDCNPCLRSDNLLEQSIAAVQTRSAG